MKDIDENLLEEDIRRLIAGDGPMLTDEAVQNRPMRGGGDDPWINRR